MRRALSYFSSCLLSVLATFVISSCDYFTEKSEIIPDYEVLRDNSYHDIPAHIGVENALKRAWQISNIKWTPKLPVPSLHPSPYKAGIVYKGLPYSLVMHVNTYVGLDVSFYTFMTAVNNPYSVLYTENVHKPPYNGNYCAPYYGTVCSTSVWYALGVKIPYFTNFLADLPFIYKPKTQLPESVQLCDILWSPGHMVMVYDIIRNDLGEIVNVSILETNIIHEYDTDIITYSMDDFVSRWYKDRWVIYRYDLLHNSSIKDDPHVIYNDINHYFDTIEFNDDICTNKGDKVAILEGSEVVLNVLSKDKYSEIELYKNDTLYREIPVSSECCKIKDLMWGRYKARLKRGNKYSNYTYFEIINVEVAVEKGDVMKVNFKSKNAKAEYMDICYARQCPVAYFPFDQNILQAGEIVLSKPQDPDPLFCKVYFRGEYGRVSNIPIPID